MQVFINKIVDKKKIDIQKKLKVQLNLNYVMELKVTIKYFDFFFICQVAIEIDLILLRNICNPKKKIFFCF